jgi:hypothetical protein
MTFDGKVNIDDRLKMANWEIGLDLLETAADFLGYIFDQAWHCFC